MRSLRNRIFFRALPSLRPWICWILSSVYSRSVPGILHGLNVAQGRVQAKACINWPQALRRLKTCSARSRNNPSQSAVGVDAVQYELHRQPENFRHIHLRVLQTYRTMFPSVVLGFSDHTPKHATVLGAVALGARVIEKHFTDDNRREGPDHPFSMTPSSWREMVDRTRELEYALGSSRKFVAENEQDTVVVQRRCLRTSQDLKAGTALKREMLEALRPAPRDAVMPFDLARVVDRKLLRDLPQGEYLRWTFLAEGEGAG